MNKKSIAASAIIGGVLIFAIKIYAWVISDSVALLSDALESIVNILASVMMFTSVLISEKPPDEEPQVWASEDREHIAVSLRVF